MKKNGIESINKKNPKIKSELEKNYINSDLNELEKLIEKEKTKYFEQNQV